MTDERTAHDFVRGENFEAVRFSQQFADAMSMLTERRAFNKADVAHLIAEQMIAAAAARADGAREMRRHIVVLLDAEANEYAEARGDNTDAIGARLHATEKALRNAATSVATLPTGGGDG